MVDKKSEAKEKSGVSVMVLSLCCVVSILLGLVGGVFGGSMEPPKTPPTSPSKMLTTQQSESTITDTPLFSLASDFLSTTGLPLR